MKKNLAFIDALGAEPHSTINYRSNYYTPFQRDTANQELGVLKAVIKCIEDYGLQGEFPPDALHARVAEIEKTKADKKRAADAAPVQMMMPLADGGYAPHRTPVVGNRLKPLTIYEERAQYHGSGGDRYIYAAPPTYEVPGHCGDNKYPYAAPPAYDVSGHSGDNRYPYAAPHEVPSHTPYGHQSSVVWPYHFQENRVPPHGSLSNYGSYMNQPIQSTPGNYGDYMISGMQQRAPSNYGSYTDSSLSSSHQAHM